MSDEFWQKSAEERANHWQMRFTVACIVAAIGWTLLITIWLCSLPIPTK